MLGPQSFPVRPSQAVVAEPLSELLCVDTVDAALTVLPWESKALCSLNRPHFWTTWCFSMSEALCSPLLLGESQFLHATNSPVGSWDLRRQDGSCPWAR